MRGEEQVALVLVLAVPTWHVISLKERRQEWSDSKCVCVFWFGDDDVARRRALLCVCKCDAWQPDVRVGFRCVERVRRRKSKLTFTSEAASAYWVV